MRRLECDTPLQENIYSISYCSPKRKMDNAHAHLEKMADHMKEMSTLMKAGFDMRRELISAQKTTEPFDELRDNTAHLLNSADS